MADLGMRLALSEYDLDTEDIDDSSTGHQTENAASTPDLIEPSDP